MLSFLRQTSPVRLAIFLLFALTAYRLWFITQMELVPDEGYYWLWSKHLAWSYRDKGPAVAWTIALGTKIFGNTVFGIRFFAVALSTATGALLFLMVPCAPASGMFYIYDRATCSFWMADIDESRCWGGYREEEFDHLSQTYGLRALAQHPRRRALAA